MFPSITINALQPSSYVMLTPEGELEYWYMSGPWLMVEDAHFIEGKVKLITSFQSHVNTMCRLCNYQVLGDL